MRYPYQQRKTAAGGYFQIALITDDAECTRDVHDLQTVQGL